MSSVNKRNRTPHRFTPLDLALDLYNHTTTVTANPKFAQRPSLKDRIESEAELIYHYCRAANEDYDNRIEEEARIRIKLQSEAIEHCLWLKTEIRLAQRKFHLRASKCTFWTGLVNNVLKYIKAWNRTETQNYKDNFGL